MGTREIEMEKTEAGENTDVYMDFAGVYDIFMEDTPYEEWADFLQELLRRYGRLEAAGTAEAGTTAVATRIAAAEAKTAAAEIEKESKETETAAKLRQERNTILDLGCGTGHLTEILSAKGYDMIGIDNAPEMLRIAMERKARSGSDILYLLQDMRNFELYGTVGAVICVCDSLNYLLKEEELLAVFRLVNNYLYPGGLFLFDFNTIYKYECVIGDATIAENREECSFIWENYYHPETAINEYDLTVFVKNDREDDDGEGNDCFRRFQETHYQRGYTLEQMKELVEKAGMTFVAALDSDTHADVQEESERVYVIAREKGKQWNAEQVRSGTS